MAVLPVFFFSFLLVASAAANSLRDAVPPPASAQVNETVAGILSTLLPSLNGTTPDPSNVNQTTEETTSEPLANATVVGTTLVLKTTIVPATKVAPVTSIVTKAVNETVVQAITRAARTAKPTTAEPTTEAPENRTVEATSIIPLLNETAPLLNDTMPLTVRFPKLEAALSQALQDRLDCIVEVNSEDTSKDPIDAILNTLVTCLDADDQADFRVIFNAIHTLTNNKENLTDCTLRQLDLPSGEANTTTAVCSVYGEFSAAYCEARETCGNSKVLDALTAIVFTSVRYELKELGGKCPDSAKLDEAIDPRLSDSSFIENIEHPIAADYCPK